MNQCLQCGAVFDQHHAINGIECLSRQLAAKDVELERLRAIVDRLPKYADTGESYVDGVDPRWMVNCCGVGQIEDFRPRVPIYSTRTAAQSAAKGGAQK